MPCPHPSLIASAVSGLPQMSSSCRKTSGQSLLGLDFGEKNPHIKNHRCHLDLRPYLSIDYYIYSIYFGPPKKNLESHLHFSYIPQWPACSFTETWRVPESKSGKNPGHNFDPKAQGVSFGGSTKRTSSLVITSTQPGPHNLV